MYKYQLHYNDIIHLQCGNYTNFIYQCRSLLIRKSNLPSDTIYKLEHDEIFNYLECILGYTIHFKGVN